MRNPVRRKHCACKLVEFRAQFRLFEWLLEITAMALASMDALPAILQSERYSRRPQARCHCAHRRIFGDMNAVAQSGDNGVGQRCIVECGTSSYYSALADACAEPVLRQICRKIAADEFRHYKLFYTYLPRYQQAENLGTWGRLRIGWGRIAESEDDELAYAYFVASGAPEPYDRKRSSRAYIRRAYAHYRRPHIERSLGMAFKAVGLKPGGWLHRGATRLATRFMHRRAARLARAGA